MRASESRMAYDESVTPQSAAAVLRGEHRRSVSLDLVRAVAIVMVMIDHCVRAEMTDASTMLTRIFVAPDAVLFFMLSGALLMPVEGSVAKFLKGRALRVFVPFLVWSAIYTVIAYTEGRIDEALMVHTIKWSWLILGENNSWLWFVPVMLSLYLVMPIVTPFIATASRRRLEYFMVVWLASGTVAWLTACESMYGPLSVFSVFLNYMGWIVAGVYVMRYPLRCNLRKRGIEQHESTRRCNALRLAACVAVGVVFPAIVWISPGILPIESLIQDNYSVTTMMWGCGLFGLMLSVDSLGKVGNAVVRLVARNSYGIYLSHVFVSSWLLPRIAPELGGEWLTALVVTLTALCISEALRRVPVVGKIMV